MTRRSTEAERTRTCPNCQRTFLAAKPSARQRYCSHSCAFATFGDKVRAASNAPEAVRKRADGLRRSGRGGGYVKRNGRHEHRAVAEEILGRPLAPGEIAFHKDGAKDNNAPDNIGIASIRGEFARALNSGSKRIPGQECKRGHSLTAENTRLGSKGERRCVICYRAYHRQYEQAKRDRARLNASA